MAQRIKSISELALWVESVPRAKQFYCSVLGFEVVEEAPEQHAFLRSGDFLLVLFNRRDPGTRLGKEYLERTGGSARGDVYHAAFCVDREHLDEFAKQVESAGFAVAGPIDFEGGRRSYFFDDLDQHYIELTDR